MNRVLRRPMFRIGGSAGTGITSGLDQPRKQYKEGTPNPYASNLMPGTLPGFLTSFGLDLLSRPPQGGFFQTVAASAKGPFETFQAAEMARAQKQGERDFAEKLAKDEREFLSGETTRKLESAEKIAGMKTTDTTERVRAIADTKYDGDIIKAQREVDFATKTYLDLINEYGEESVATTVIDSSGLQKPKDINRFVKQNPQLARQVVYDVRTGKAMKFAKDQTGKFALIPADSADIDTTGEGQPTLRDNPGLFGQPTKPEKDLKEILPDLRDSGFDEEFYQ